MAILDYEMEKREKYARKVLASGKAIEVTNALMRGLGYDNTRDFFRELGDWGYGTDFGQFSEAADTNIQSYLRHFIRDTFIN